MRYHSHTEGSARVSQLVETVDQLDARGHRVTPSRLSILAAVYATGEPFPAEVIHQRLPQVGRATVFRTIKLLVEEGVLCRVRMDDGRLLYQWSRRGHHHHLICRTCGAVRDLSACGVGELLEEALRATGFAMEGHWLEVYGRCPICRDAPGVRA